MASTLPEIRQGSSLLNSQYEKEGGRDCDNDKKSLKSSTPARSRSANSRKLAMKRVMMQKEIRAEEKKEFLRQQLAYLSKQETAEYRGTRFQNLCVKILQAGYHISFSELFKLVKMQEKDRLRAGPDSILWTKVQLYNEQVKLDILKEHLTASEDAMRKGDYRTVYEHQLTLATHFGNDIGDKWIADYFYELCLATSELEEGEEGLRMRAEGYRNFGLAMQKNGRFSAACENFETYHEIASASRNWLLRSGESMYRDACRLLCSVYDEMSEEAKGRKDFDLVLSYSFQAYQTALGSGESALESRVRFRLGLAHALNNNLDDAIECLEDYYRHCDVTKDVEGMGEVCEAIARAHESAGTIVSSLPYLEHFCEISEEGKNEKCLARAYAVLGSVFNTMGQYQKASDYFQKAYHLSRSLGNIDAVAKTRVQFGVAMAHTMLLEYSNHVASDSREAMEKVFQWKSQRVANFDKPLND